jgi:hypothetical protein
VHLQKQFRQVQAQFFNYRNISAQGLLAVETFPSHGGKIQPLENHFRQVQEHFRQLQKQFGVLQEHLCQYRIPGFSFREVGIQTQIIQNRGISSYFCGVF